MNGNHVQHLLFDRPLNRLELGARRREITPALARPLGLRPLAISRALPNLVERETPRGLVQLQQQTEKLRQPLRQCQYCFEILKHKRLFVLSFSSFCHCHPPCELKEPYPLSYHI